MYIVILVWVVMAHSAYAGIQRMAIQPGQYAVRTGDGGVTVGARCLDGHLDPPPAGHVFDRVAPGQISVTRTSPTGEIESSLLEDVLNRNGWLRVVSESGGLDHLSIQAVPDADGTVFIYSVSILPGGHALANDQQEYEFSDLAKKAVALGADLLYIPFDELGDDVLDLLQLESLRQQHRALIWSLSQPERARRLYGRLEVKLRPINAALRAPDTRLRFELALGRPLTPDEMPRLRSMGVDVDAQGHRLHRKTLGNDVLLVRRDDDILVYEADADPWSLNLATPIDEQISRDRVILVLPAARQLAALQYRLGAAQRFAVELSARSMFLKLFGDAARTRTIVVAPITEDEASSMFGDVTGNWSAFKELRDRGHKIEIVSSSVVLRQLVESYHSEGLRTRVIAHSAQGDVVFPDGGRQSLHQIERRGSEVFTCYSIDQRSNDGGSNGIVTAQRLRWKLLACVAEKLADSRDTSLVDSVRQFQSAYDECLTDEQRRLLRAGILISSLAGAAVILTGDEEISEDREE